MNKRQKDKMERLDWIKTVIELAIKDKHPIEISYLRSQLVVNHFLSESLANSEIEAIMKINGFKFKNGTIIKSD